MVKLTRNPYKYIDENEELIDVDGCNIDVNMNQDIEVNMGGLSLIGLADRSASYTNSFSLPRTPINEAIFNYISIPSNNFNFNSENSVQINSTLTTGSLQKKVVIKPLEIDKTIKVSLRYDSDSLLEKFKSQDAFFFGNDRVVTDISGSNQASTITKLWYIPLDIGIRDSVLFPVITNGYIASTKAHQFGNTAAFLSDIFSAISEKYNVTFDGDIITDVDFLRCYMMLPNYVLELFEDSGVYKIAYKPTLDFASKITFADVLKVVCQMFFADFKINNNTITLNKVNFNNDSIRIEGWGSVSNKKSAIYGSINNVLYNVADKTKLGLGGTSFTGDSTGEKTVLNIANYVPITDTIGYIFSPSETADKISILVGTQEFRTLSMYDESNVLYEVNDINGAYSSILSMLGTYDILSDIFANPVILEASRYIDPITADTIMNNRVITSVQLGGRYWVDQFAYNLTTGQSKLTLIKLP